MGGQGRYPCTHLGGVMTEPERTTPTKWHESAAQVLVVLLLVALITSPCWGLALVLWVTR